MNHAISIIHIPRHSVTGERAAQDIVSHHYLPTQPGDASHAVVFPWLVETGFAYASKNRAVSGADPSMTQTTRQTLCLVGFLSKQYGGLADPKSMSICLDGPTGTITTWDHHALVSLPNPMLISINEFDHRVIPAGEDATGTMMAREKWGLIQPPAFIAEMHGTSKASGVDEPLMCIAAGGAHHALLSPDAFLTYYYGTQQASGMTDPVHTMTGIDRAGLVGALENMTVDDLTFRMLQPHEIGKAMAFPGSYVVLGTNRDKVRQYGNAVTPPVMEMIIKRCVETLS